MTNCSGLPLREPVFIRPLQTETRAKLAPLYPGDYKPIQTVDSLQWAEKNQGLIGAESVRREISITPKSMQNTNKPPQ